MIKINRVTQNHKRTLAMEIAVLNFMTVNYTLPCACIQMFEIRAISIAISSSPIAFEIKLNFNTIKKKLKIILSNLMH